MTKFFRQLLRFLIVGATTVLIDFIIYRSAMILGVLTPFAKAAGFFSGTFFAYHANRRWTFEIPQARAEMNEVVRFSALYGATLMVNVVVNTAMLSFFEHRENAILAAFIIATGISAVLNFVGMKFLIFRPSAV